MRTLTGVKNIIAVSSGKGGVGKTTIAVNLAIALARKGFSVGLLDADVFGPSVPRMVGAEDYKPDVFRMNDTDMIVPLTRYGVKVLSTGFFVSPSDAVILERADGLGIPEAAHNPGDWGELDYLLFDLLPEQAIFI